MGESDSLFAFSDEASDVTIVAENARISAHKLVLSLASPVFKAMFQNQMQENINDEVVISDFSKEVVRSFLKCIYDSTLIENELMEYAQQLLFIAYKYEVTNLANKVKSFMVQHITIENAVNMLHFASKFDENEIKLGILEEMSKNAAYFLQKVDFIQSMGEELLHAFNCYLATNCFEPNGNKRQRL